ncbi:MAG: cob(I)yrinic acid a,c-diamide adenosyltransferase [bacterium]|nr:cob(I)yrinic acid a,c-diamide adenosyltransferase [bacterium]
MVHIYHGDGKGKTTAAMGLAVRAAGVGNLVSVVQFLKGNPTGELEILSRIPEVTILRNEVNHKFTFQMTEEEKQELAVMHNLNLMQAIDKINRKECDTLILDELLDVYNMDLIDKNMVRTLLEMRPKELEIVMTGRNPDEYLISQADYITNMKKEKHPFDKGLPARRGVEF